MILSHQILFWIHLQRQSFVLFLVYGGKFGIAKTKLSDNKYIFNALILNIDDQRKIFEVFNELVENKVIVIKAT